MKLKLNKNRIYYTASILTIAIIVVVGIVYLIRKPESAAAWFNDDWYYRQSVPITNGGSALTDYQIAITLDTATLITAGKMQSDCDDIRFTDAQGNVLSYWIEENNPGCNSATTKIWTKASSVPAGSSTIYLYYGNQSASNAQNGNNVFTFFDDFSINLSKWINPTGCAATITSGVMQISSSTGCDSTPVYVNSLSLSDATGYIMEFRGKFSSGGGGRLQTYQRYRPSNGHSGRFWTSGINTTAYQEWTGSFGGTTNVGANNMAADTWYNVKVQVKDSNNTYYVNGTSIGSTTSTASLSPLTDLSIGLGQYSTTVQYDNARLRKYAATEPTIGSLGTEEKGAAPVAYWRFDEGYGTTTQDNTTNNNDLTLNSLAWNNEDKCLAGKCVSTDADGDYAASASSPTFNTYNELTYNVWVKFNAAYTSSASYRWPIIMSNSNGGTHTGYGLRTQIFPDQNGNYNTIYFEWGRSPCDGTSYTSITVANNTIDNLWHMYTVTYDGTTVKAYLDGNYIRQVTQAGGFCNVGANVMKIGERSSGSPNMALDNFKIYNYARTATQVNQDYSSGKAGVGSESAANVAMGASNQKWMSDGLVGYWPMDETSWTNDCSTATVLDASGNSNTGKSCPVTTGSTGGVIGKYGNGGSFDGINDEISITDSNSLDFNNVDFSLSFWIKIGELVNTAGIIAKNPNSNAGSSNYAIWKWQDDIDLYVGTGTPGQYDNVRVNNLTQNEWVYITATFEAATSTMKIYKNSVLQQTKVTAIDPGANSGVLGFASLGGGNYFNGQLDELRIYNRALSNAEVTKLYEWAPGPARYWTLDENTGTTAYDSSGNNNSATSNGTIGWALGKRGSSLNLSTGAAANNVYSAGGNNLANTGALTLEAWVNPASYGSEEMTVIQNTYYLSVYNNGSINCYWYGTTPAGYHSSGAGTVPLNQWTHITCAWDGSNIRLYTNGILKNTIAVTGDGNDPGGINIGAENTTRQFRGRIDDVKIYNYARTAKQIQEDMNGGIAGPVAYWPMEEGQGGSVLDSTGYSSTGTLTIGATGTQTTVVQARQNGATGKFGKSLNFDGTDDYAGCGTTLGGSTATPKDFSFSLWFYRTDNDSSEDHMFNLSTSHQFTVRGSPKKLWFGRGAAPGVSLTGNTTINQSQWYHAVVTYDSQSTALNLYLNGKLDGSTTSTIYRDESLSVGCRIGDYAGGGYNFNGQIDEVKVYNYALTAEDIKKDYNQGATTQIGSGVESGSTGAAPVAHWRLDDNTGTSAVDFSGNGSTGTLTNGPTWTVGKIGPAVKFDGDNDFISIGDTLGTLTEGTVSLWFKRHTSKPTYQMMFTDGGSQLEICYNTDTLYFYVNNVRVATSSANSTNWNHVEGTFSETGNFQRLYLNGALVNSSTYPGDATAAVRYLGSRNATFPFDGVIDEVKVYNYARTTAQVAYDYNRGEPIGYWALDDGSGVATRDFSGNGSSGTLTNATWTTSGKYDNAVSFDGAGDCVNVGDPSSGVLDFGTGDFSTGAWVYLTSAPGGYVGVLNKGGSGAVGYGINIGSNSKIYVMIQATGGTNQGFASTATLATGTWYHILATYDRDDVMKLYINGVLDKSNGYSAGNDGSVNNASNLTFGTYSDCGQYFLNGKLDDVRVYNYALTAEQVKQAMIQGGSARY